MEATAAATQTSSIWKRWFQERVPGWGASISNAEGQGSCTQSRGLVTPPEGLSSPVGVQLECQVQSRPVAPPRQWSHIVLG